MGKEHECLVKLLGIIYLSLEGQRSTKTAQYRRSREWWDWARNKAEEAKSEGCLPPTKADYLIHETERGLEKHRSYSYMVTARPADEIFAKIRNFMDYLCEGGE